MAKCCRSTGAFVHRFSGSPLAACHYFAICDGTSHVSAILDDEMSQFMELWVLGPFITASGYIGSI